MRLALYQPDIPQNTGALLRLGACLEVPVDIIEPCGFIIDDKRLRRVAMDYAATCDISRHSSWEVFLSNHRSRGQGRMVLLAGDHNQLQRGKQDKFHGTDSEIFGIRILLISIKKTMLKG